MTALLIDLKAVLTTTPERWNALTAHVSEDALRRRPAPGEWSALECLLHLIDMERSVFPPRVRAIRAGQNFPAFFPDETGSTLTDAMSAPALAAEFAALRSASLLLLDEIAPDELARTAVHAELGPVTLSHLLHEWGGHDLMHLMQAEHALMQPFITGCGPWEIYFTQHKVGG